MDYYRLADGTHVTSEKAAKASGQKFEAVVVPTDKQGLMDYLNRLAAVRGATLAAEVAPVRGVSSPPTAQRPPVALQPAPKLLPDDRAARLIALEETIQNATGFELSSLMGNVMSRLEELRKEAGLRKAE